MDRGVDQVQTSFRYKDIMLILRYSTRERLSFFFIV